MRLIDIEDEPLLKTVSVGGLSAKALWRLIKSQRTIKAIPIEWIKDYIIPFQVHHDCLSEELKENDGAGWVVDVLEGMLKKWEKENE